MSGVRNLRAMFEQRGENNPPDRGRSPGEGSISVGSPSPTDSPRPLSKVRTTFVAVEKDGILGLRRQHSGDSASVESGKESIETEPITSQPVSEKPDTVMENMARNISALKLNLSREGSVDSPRNSPRLAPAPQFSMKKDLESPGLAPNPNPDKTTDEEDTKAKLLPADPTEKAAIRGKGVTSPGSASGPTSIGKPKTAVTKAAPKTAPISISAKSVSSAPRSPNFTKAGTSTPKASGRSSNLAPKKAVSAPSSDHEGSKKSSIPAAVRTSKKPAPVELPPAGSTFAKPKAKSPTRPIKLPPSLTSLTASTASKIGAPGAAQPPRQSLSRASTNSRLNGPASAHRPSSRTSASAVAPKTKALRRQSSSVPRPRPSLGPPPKPVSKDHPVSKKESNVDESFLARMMRPTQSSSSKASEKAPITPPRKQTTPTTGSKKSVARDVEGSAKKTVAKVQASTNKLKAATQGTKPVTKKASTAKEVAPVASQAETAEVAIETAKVSNDTATTPVVEKAESEVISESPASDDGKVEKSPEPEVEAPAPAEDAEKVEVVEEAVEEPVQQKSLEPAIEMLSAETEEPQVAEDVSATSETSIEAVAVDNVAEESVAEKEEAKVEEPEKESVQVEDVQVEEAKSEVPSEDA